MPEFKKSGGFKMKGPTFFKSALKKYGKAPVKDYDVKKGSHDHPHGKPSPAKQGKFGKVLGNVLTGGVSGVIGKIREKRKAKKAGMEADPAAAAAAPEGMEQAAVAGGAPTMKKGKKRKAMKSAKKYSKAFKAGAAEGMATMKGKSPAKQGKAGKIIGGLLTGGVSNVIGAIRKKRKAKKAGAGVAPEAAAAAMGGPENMGKGAPVAAQAPMMKKGNKPKVKYRKRKRLA